MYEKPRGAIPKIIVFIVVMVLGIWFAVPSEVSLGTMIIQAVANTLIPFGNGQVNQMASSFVLYFEIFGVALIVADIIAIYAHVRRGEYF